MERHKAASACIGELMTRFFIDNKEIDQPLDISSLSQILKQVESAHLPTNSVVKSIQIDGLPVTPSNCSDRVFEMSEQIEKRNTVEIFTGTLTEIANESIAEAMAYLDRIELATPSLAESFRFCPVPESYENLRQLCEGFYWLNMLMEKLEINFQIHLETMFISGVPAPQYHQKFISILKQLIESQETGDLVLISDLLEYEILPLVAIWREMLGAISTKMSVTQ
jgi:hypothetical protein